MLVYAVVLMDVIFITVAIFITGAISIRKVVVAAASSSSSSSGSRGGREQSPRQWCR